MEYVSRLMFEFSTCLKTWIKLAMSWRLNKSYSTCPGKWRLLFSELVCVVVDVSPSLTIMQHYIFRHCMKPLVTYLPLFFFVFGNLHQKPVTMFGSVWSTNYSNRVTVKLEGKCNVDNQNAKWFYVPNHSIFEAFLTLSLFCGLTRVWHLIYKRIC